MTRRPLASEIAVELGVKERVLLFCLASGTDWERAGFRHAAAQHMLVRGLIDRKSGPARFKLTPLGRDALAALLKTPIDEQDG
jgi:hypothetical protein